MSRLKGLARLNIGRAAAASLIAIVVLPLTSEGSAVASVPAATLASGGSTFSVTVTPDTGLPTTGSSQVTVTSSNWPVGSSGSYDPAIVLECNSDPTQPTFSLFGNNLPVGCTQTAGPTIAQTPPTNPSISFTIQTGTMYASNTATDSTGGNAGTDSANYPCPPTSAELAKGVYCGLVVTALNGLAPAALAEQPLLFTGESGPTATVAPATGAAGTSVTLSGTGWPIATGASYSGTYQVCGVGGSATACTSATGTGPTIGASSGALTGSLTIPSSMTSACSTCFIQVNAVETVTQSGVTATIDATAGAAFSVTAGSSGGGSGGGGSGGGGSGGGGSTGPPTVTEVAPDQGPPAGGNQVAVVGTNLTGATAIDFGTAAGTTVKVLSDTEATVTVPAGTGTVDVTVTTPLGSSTAGTADKYTYQAPTSPTFTSAGTPSISLSPDTGLSTTGTTTAQLSGTGFSASDSLYITLECNDDPNQPTFQPFAAFGSTQGIPIGCNVGNVESISGGTFTFASPGYVIESGNVGANDGGSDSTGGTASSDAAQYPCPPTSGQQSAGYVCALVAAGVGTVNGSIGLVDIAAQPLGFTGEATPTMSASPPAGSPGTSITLSGSDWPVAPGGASFQGTVSVCSSPSTCVTAQGGSASVDSSGALTGSFTIPSGLPSSCPQCVVKVSGSEQIPEGGAKATVSGSGEMPFGIFPGSSSSTGAPTVSGISPSSGSSSGGTSVTITGTGFGSGATVDFGTNPATGVTVNSPTSITATAPAGTGTVDVTVTVGGVTSAVGSADSYSYSGGGSSAVSVTSVSPDFGSANGGTGVVIFGTGFTSNANAVSAVSFGSVPAPGFTVVSDSEIEATAPAQADGTVVNVGVTTSNGSTGTGSASTFYYVGPPRLTVASPTSGNASGGDSGGCAWPPLVSSPGSGCVVLTGFDFNGTLTVQFGTVNATHFQAVSNSEIIVSPPAGNAGAVPITVTGPAGTSGGVTYSYNGQPNAPTITGIAPDTGSLAGGQDVTITGSNFVPGAIVCFGVATETSNQWTFTGQVAPTVDVVSNGVIAVTTPSGPAGAVQVVVKTSGGVSGGAPSVGPCGASGSKSISDEFFYGSTAGAGYWMVGSDGGVFTQGGLSFYGSLAGLSLPSPIISMAAMPAAAGSAPGAPPAGYWLVDSQGDVYTPGTISSTCGGTGSGSTNGSEVNQALYYGGIHQQNPCLPPGGSNALGACTPLEVKALNQTPVPDIVGIAATPDGKGYWLVDRYGCVYSFGDATFYGDPAKLNPALPAGGSNSVEPLAAPVVGIAATPDGKGYWEVAADGGVFAFPPGNGLFFGSRASGAGAPVVVGMAPTADGNGYWIAAANGQVYAYGDAVSYGSTTQALLAPVESIIASADGNGYWLFERDGAVESFGDAPYDGGLCNPGGTCLALVRPIVGAAA